MPISRSRQGDCASASGGTGCALWPFRFSADLADRSLVLKVAWLISKDPAHEGVLCHPGRLVRGFQQLGSLTEILVPSGPTVPAHR